MPSPLRLRFWSLVALLVGSLATPAVAQRPYLVRDLNPAFPAPPSREIDNPAAIREFGAVGDKAVFTAFEPSAWHELWVSDGTALGTEMLADACPGPCGDEIRIVGSTGKVLFFLPTLDRGSASFRLWRTDGTRKGTFPLKVRGPGQTFGGGNAFVVTDKGLYLNSCGAEGCELWKSDGTHAGTALVKDITPGEDSSYPEKFVALGERAFFTAEGRVWTSDGTSAGTVKLADVYARALVAAGGKVFFVALRSGTPEEWELWVTDGTGVGTRPLTSFSNPDSFLGSLQALGQSLYFVADDGVGGAEIWRSDGTSAGTRRVTDVASGSPSRDSPSPLAEIDGRLLFHLAGTLWVSSGTPETTQPLDTGCPGGCPAGVVIRTFALVGDRLLFTVADDPFSQSVRALWSTDGTAAGTFQVKDFCPGECSDEVQYLQVHLGKAFFSAKDPANGTELWVSDGTPNGTRRVSQFVVDNPFEYDFRYGLTGAAAGDRFLFAATDPTYGRQLWATDGTLAGTRLVTVIGAKGRDGAPFGLEEVAGQAVFAACDGSSMRLWRSAGSRESTQPIADGPAGMSCGDGYTWPSDMTSVGNQLFFWLDLDVGEGQLWRTDPTGGGTRQLTQFPDFAPSVELVPFGGGVAFFRRSTSPPELWTSDGTVAGTGLGFVFPPTLSPSHIGLHSTGDRLFFSARESGQGGEQLWTSDGTPAGTFKLADFPGDGFVQLGGQYYFLGSGQLWKSNGTPAGTVSVFMPPPFGAGSNASGLTVFDGALYFSARSRGTSGYSGLWRSGGTAGATALVKEIPSSGFGVTRLENLTVAGGRLFFTAPDEEHGTELWTSDGTPGGTVLVRDIYPGPTSSSPGELTAFAGKLYFAADDGPHGFELWTSDGTPSGTRLVGEIAPGFLSSLPGELTVAGGRLYFGADDGLRGRELWALPASGPAACTPSATTLCLGGGRFAVEVLWRDFDGNTGPGQAVALTADTGYFWFFGPANVETVVKVLDGVGVNGHHWLFYGSLSSVEFTITATDTLTGAATRYYNPSGNFASVGDTEAFGPRGAAAVHRPSALVARQAVLVEERFDPAAAAAPCTPAPQRLCLNGDRFAVTAAWTDFDDRSGVGIAQELTDDTGYFWFFGAANVEVVLKVLDGRGVNGKFWVFYGALSNVEYTLTVTDTATGTVRTYRNPRNRFASAGDTGAF